MRGRRVIVPVWRRQGGQLLEQARLVGGDHLGQRVKELQGRGEIEEMLVAPGAGEVFGDRGLRLATPRIPQRREPRRVALARDDGSDNRQPCRAGEVGDGAVDLDVHLIERLLHPLHAARPLFDEIRHLPVEGAQPHDGVAGAEGAPQEPAAMQQLQPLAVLEVGLATRNIVQLARIDQHWLNAACFQ